MVLNMSGSVLAVSCRALVAYAQARNHPTEPWLRRVGLTPKQLEDPEARLEPRTIFELWREAYDACGDPALALHVAESLTRGAYRAVEYLAAHAPTVGSAYSKIADYFSVIDSTTELVIEANGEAMSFGPRRVNNEPTIYPAVEYMLTACHLRVLDMTETAHRPIGLTFASRPQAHQPELERVFGCPVEWNAPSHRIVFSMDDWNKPTAHADPALLMVLEEHAQNLREKHPRSVSLSSLLDRVLQQVLEQPAEASPSLELAARRLGVSSRTLQRRLQEEGTSFAHRMDEARKRTTLQWLQCRDLSLAEVAYLAGFKEQASLTRAVLRWTGSTPRQLRSLGTLETL